MLLIENFFSSIQLVHISFILIFLQLFLIHRVWNKSIDQNKVSEALRLELDTLLLCERGMAARIKRQQAQMHGISDRQERVETNGYSQVNYKQAIALMKKGASTDELVEACDISRGELELISHLQRSKRRLQ